MNDNTHASPEQRLPGEVVERYIQPDPREVVERYVRPLPGRRSAPARPSRRRGRTGLWVFLLCLGVTLALAVGTWTWNTAGEVRRDRFYFDYEEQESSADTEAVTIPTYPYGQGVTLEVAPAGGTELTAQEIYRLVNPSVVTVLAQLEDGVSVGTGVIFTQDGYILTNYHVVSGGRDASVTLDSGRSYEAKYVAGDAENDLAVLKVDLTGLPAAAFGDSDALTVGDKVYAIGNPLGVELRGTLTDGIVSAINRDVWVEGRKMTLIQTNAALNSGNSGGPLINVYGQVVGINTIKMSSAYSNVEGLGFALPSSSIQYLVNDLLECGQVRPEPELGVSVLQLGVRLDEDLWGVEVVEVNPRSAAEKAGVRVGDFIVSAAGAEVTSSQDLLRIRRQFHVGDELPLTLWREGEQLEVTLVLQGAGDSAS